MITVVESIVHSGTHFADKFHKAVLGLDGRSGMGNYHTEGTGDYLWFHPFPDEIERVEGLRPPDIADCLIAVIRDPEKAHLTETRSRPEPPEEPRTSLVTVCWEELEKEMPKYAMVLLLTIDGPVDNRFNELWAIAQHFVEQRERNGLLPLIGMDTLEERVRKYADAWQPLNVSLSVADSERLAPAKAFYASLTNGN